jgi:hypothetical protein
MKTFWLALLIVASSAAQDQTGRIEGVVLDSASHQPVKKAIVSLTFMGTTASGATPYQDPPPLTTDVSGTFAFHNLPSGPYRLIVMHQDYPEARLGGVPKTVQVAAGEHSGSVTVELSPGAAVSGHIVDEDGDPLSGCMVQIHPAANFNRGVPMLHTPMAREDGSYRIFGIPAAKYTITAQCSAAVFQPRPLSAGPDPPPAAAYPLQFYPGASELKSAEIVELAPGVEKSGVNFQMKPVPVTHIKDALASEGADWRDHNDLRVQLLPINPRDPLTNGFGTGGRINPKDGTFELPKVFPGSYRLIVFSRESMVKNQVGAVVRVDVADKPLELSVQLHAASDVTGTIEMERSTATQKQIALNLLLVQLTSDTFFSGPPAPAQVREDGTFTIKSVLPGEWRIRLMGPSVFVKSVWIENDDITGRPLDLTSGNGAANLRIVASTNTATIRGTAPAGQIVSCEPLDDDAMGQAWKGAQSGSDGQFTLDGLPPGKYRILLGQSGGPFPEEGGQELTLHEGETVTIDVRPETSKS